MPSGQIFAGNPARMLRKMTAEESAFAPKSAENYAKLAAVHAAENSKDWPAVAADIEARAERLGLQQEANSFAVGTSAAAVQA